MRLQIFIITFLSLMFQSCTMLNNYSVGGYRYSSANKVVKVELTNVTGNDLRFIERITFIRTLKEKLAQRGRVVLGTTPKLELKVVINRTITHSTQHKTVQHGIVTYYLDEHYQTSTVYTITDKAGLTPVRGVINYNVLVKARSIVDYDDAKRIALKKLFEAIATKVANDISAKSSILAVKYN